MQLFYLFQFVHIQVNRFPLKRWVSIVLESVLDADIIVLQERQAMAYLIKGR